MDEYKLDTRVTILFSKAQVNALREVARKRQTSLSGLIRRWVVSELQVNYPSILQNNINIVKEYQDD